MIFMHELSLEVKPTISQKMYLCFAANLSWATSENISGFAEIKKNIEKQIVNTRQPPLVSVFGFWQQSLRRVDNLIYHPQHRTWIYITMGTDTHTKI